jgi:hypothetical protein
MRKEITTGLRLMPHLRTLLAGNDNFEQLRSLFRSKRETKTSAINGEQLFFLDQMTPFRV